MPTKYGFTEKCYGCKYLSLCGHGYACTNENYCNNADNMDELSLELKESEDERIRNWLIAQLELKSDVNNPHDLELMILKSMAWLEKQNSNVDKANKEYWRGYREGKQEILDKYTELEKQEQKPRKVSIWKHWKDGICGNGEGLPIYLIRDGNTYSLSSCLGFECDYIELSELDNLMLEKQDWSEEDENIIDTIIQIYHPSKKIMDWLKSLKDRVQPKQKHDD